MSDANVPVARRRRRRIFVLILFFAITAGAGWWVLDRLKAESELRAALAVEVVPAQSGEAWRAHVLAILQTNIVREGQRLRIRSEEMRGWFREAVAPANHPYVVDCGPLGLSVSFAIGQDQIVVPLAGAAAQLADLRVPPLEVHPRSLAAQRLTGDLCDLTRSYMAGLTR